MTIWIGQRPDYLDVHLVRGDDAELSFEHSFGAAANVDEAVFQVRLEPEGLVLLALTLTANAARWDFSVSNEGTVTIDGGDFAAIVAGRYHYALRLTHTDGTDSTFARGRLILVSDDADTGDVNFSGYWQGPIPV